MNLNSPQLLATLSPILSGTLLHDIKEEESGVPSTIISIDDLEMPTSSSNNTNSDVIPEVDEESEEEQDTVIIDHGIGNHDLMDSTISSASSIVQNDNTLDSSENNIDEIIPDSKSHLLPLSDSSVIIDKFLGRSNEELLPPLPNELDLLFENNNSENENTLELERFSNNSTPISTMKNNLLLNQLSHSSTVDNNDIMLQNISMSSPSTPSSAHGPNIAAAARSSPYNNRNLNENIDLDSNDTNDNDDTIILNNINTSFDLSKALEMTSPTNLSDPSDTNSHKKINSLSSVITAGLIQHHRSQSPIFIQKSTNNNNAKTDDEKIYQLSNIDFPNRNRNSVAMDISSMGNVHNYMADAMSHISLESSPIMSTTSNIDTASMTSNNIKIDGSKKLPFLRRASSQLLRKTSFKLNNEGIKNNKSEIVMRHSSSPNTPIVNHGSTFEIISNNISRTTSNIIPLEPIPLRMPTMTRNASFGSKMKRGFTRIVSNSNKTSNPTSSLYRVSSISSNEITPTKPNRPPLNFTSSSPLENSNNSNNINISITPISYISTNTNASNKISSPSTFISTNDSKENASSLSRKSSTRKNNSRYVELNQSILDDFKTKSLTTIITDQINTNDSKSLDKIVKQSKLSLLPTSISSSFSNTSSNKNNSKNEHKPDRISIKEYTGLLKKLKLQEIEQYDVILKNLQNNGWYSKQELHNINNKKYLLNKLWNDRISFYQNQL